MRVGCLIVLQLLMMLQAAAGEIPEVANSKVRNFLESYDRSAPPSTDESTEVKLGIYINHFDFSPKDQTMELYTYMRLSWKDDRLVKLFEDEDESKKISVEYSAQKYFWKPDVFIRNHRSGSTRALLMDESLFRLNKTGYVWHVVSIASVLSCPSMHEYNKGWSNSFACPISLESYSHTMDTLHLNWLSSPVDVDPTISVSGFTLKDVILYDCSRNYTAGAFPCLEVKFQFEADSMSDYVGHALYVSSLLLVIVAWAAFWLDGARQMSARFHLGLGVAGLLVLELIAAGQWYGEERLGGARTQLWLVMCATLAVVPIAQLALVHLVLQKLCKKLCNKTDDSTRINEDGNEIGEGEGKFARVLDLITALVVFPVLLFALIIYFLLQHVH